MGLIKLGMGSFPLPIMFIMLRSVWGPQQPRHWSDGWCHTYHASNATSYVSSLDIIICRINYIELHWYIYICVCVCYIYIFYHIVPALLGHHHWQVGTSQELGRKDMYAYNSYNTHASHSKLSLREFGPCRSWLQKWKLQADKKHKS